MGRISCAFNQGPIDTFPHTEIPSTWISACIRSLVVPTTLVFPPHLYYYLAGTTRSQTSYHHEHSTDYPTKALRPCPCYIHLSWLDHSHWVCPRLIALVGSVLTYFTRLQLVFGSTFLNVVQEILARAIYLGIIHFCEIIIDEYVPACVFDISNIDLMGRRLTCLLPSRLPSSFIDSTVYRRPQPFSNESQPWVAPVAGRDSRGPCPALNTVRGLFLEVIYSEPHPVDLVAREPRLSVSPQYPSHPCFTFDAHSTLLTSAHAAVVTSIVLNSCKLSAMAIICRSHSRTS